MEYQVPQFIEVEDKIFGPLTLKQFIYLAGGIGLCVVLILYLPLVLGIILALPVAAFSAALAFYKVNNKSFTDMLAAGFSFYSKDRLYLWKKEEKSEERKVVAPVTPLPAREKLGISSGRLKDLALSLDIKDQNSP
ncbi:MAG: seg [Parcubacteria group bacterium]|nr:seg [Parcubacteria group bacterium]